MVGRFDRQPIHRKIVSVALVAFAASLLVATLLVTAIDLWRFRQSAISETVALAAILAENTSTSLVFRNRGDAERTLETLRARPVMRQACLYLPDQSLFAEYGRDAAARCAPTRPTAIAWTSVVGSAPVVRNGELMGWIRVERDVADLVPRLIGTALVDVMLLLGVGMLSIVVARRLERSITQPLSELAEAAGRIQADTVAPALPSVGHGEVGELSRALTAMVRRVGDASEELRRRDAEREELLAREREVGRLKDEFLAAMSHELRTPLNAIVGWSHVLNSGRVNQETMAKGLASIERSARAQAKLIDDLVDVSRIVSGKLVLRPAPVDLREIVSSAAEAIRPTALAKHLRFDVSLPETPCFVNGDRDRLTQVVTQLLSNAIKFTTQGSVSVSVQPRGTTGEIVIADTGTGINPSFLPFVFDRFRQADGSLTREHGGLGLGLSIVKELTERQGGTVRAESAGPGRGSTFIVSLPSIAGPVAVNRPAAPSAAAPDHILSGVRVLVADDNLDAAEALSTCLEAVGATVRIAVSGARALLEWEREPGDILLCDLAMPGLDGYEVARRIRQRDAVAGRRSHAVAITAHVSDEHRARSFNAGFEAYVTKPYEFSDLLRTIVGVLQHDPTSQPSAARAV